MVKSYRLKNFGKLCSCNVTVTGGIRSLFSQINYCDTGSATGVRPAKKKKTLFRDYGVGSSLLHHAFHGLVYTERIEQHNKCTSVITS